MINCKKILTDRILSQTQEYYKVKSQQMLESQSLSEILQRANKYYQEELRRCETYLLFDIKSALVQEFKQQMLL